MQVCHSHVHIYGPIGHAATGQENQKMSDHAILYPQRLHSTHRDIILIAVKMYAQNHGTPAFQKNFLLLGDRRPAILFARFYHKCRPRRIAATSGRVWGAIKSDRQRTGAPQLATILNRAQGRRAFARDSKTQRCERSLKMCNTYTKYITYLDSCSAATEVQLITM